MDAEILKGNLEWFKANQGKRVRIEGNCDERGTVEYNLVLGQKRADSTKNYLVNLGVDGKVYGYHQLWQRETSLHREERRLLGEEQKSSLRTATLNCQERRRVDLLPSLSFPTQSSSPNIFSLTEESKEEIQKVAHVFPLKIPEFYLNLVDKEDPSCPLRRQSVPSQAELAGTGHVDPLDEQRFSITASFLKKYPGRGVFLAGSTCAMYCRFCNRRRLVGREWDPRASWEESFHYMEGDEELREVIVSGGDPFTLPVEDFSYMMERLTNIDRIKTVRISTRLPVVFRKG